MSNLRLAAAFALLRKTAALPAQPVTQEAAEPSMPDPEAERIQAEKQELDRAKQQLDLERQKAKLTKQQVDLQRDEFNAARAAAGLENEQADFEAEQEQREQEQAQLEQEQAAMMQPGMEAPPNAMVAANQDQMGMPKTAGAAPFYFGIVDREKMNIFRPDIPRTTGDRR